MHFVFMAVGFNNSGAFVITCQKIIITLKLILMVRYKRGKKGHVISGCGEKSGLCGPPAKVTKKPLIIALGALLQGKYYTILWGK